MSLCCLCLGPGAGSELGMSAWLRLRQLPGLGMCLVQEHPLVALPDPLPGRVPKGFW